MGIEVAYDRLPIQSVVLRSVGAFQFDPLRMISSGTLAVTLPSGQIDAASADSEALGVPFALVSRVVAGGEDGGSYVTTGSSVTPTYVVRRMS
ncbi:MAG: hypothetical protein J7M39_03020 [Anaerolineae bacterium]|nr:hypothetical protein [Anaerolineae bacterium]